MIGIQVHIYTRIRGKAEPRTLRTARFFNVIPQKGDVIEMDEGQAIVELVGWKEHPKEDLYFPYLEVVFSSGE
jgi:hypothetical protein